MDRHNLDLELEHYENVINSFETNLLWRLDNVEARIVAICKSNIRIICCCLFLFVCLLSSPRIVNAEWTKTNTAMEIVYTAITVVDWSQTRYLSRNPISYKYEYGPGYSKTTRFEYTEINPILGKHPHKDTIDIWFLSTIVIHPLISMAVPDKYRVWFQAVSIGYEAAFVGNNIYAGISARF